MKRHLVLALLAAAACSKAAPEPSAPPAPVAQQRQSSEPRAPDDAPVPEPIPSLPGPSELVVTLDASSHLKVTLNAEDFPIGEAALQHWVTRSAEAVVQYLGGTFPVPSSRLRVLPRSGSDIGFGSTDHGSVPIVNVRLGTGVNANTLAEDWVAVHELIHVTFPLTPKRWIGEGLATYAEPIARLRAGHLTPEKAWERIVVKMPLGNPRKGDRGLNHTSTWARTYWGGALFFFLADMLLHEAGGEHDVSDFIRVINEAGGDGRDKWAPDRVFRVADKGLGMNGTLYALYDEHANNPVHTDLDVIFRSLGIVVRGGKVTLDDTAPRAELRRAMERD